MDAGIDKLYQNYEILSNAVDKKAHQLEYMEILNAVKGSDKEKRLATQFIGKFVQYFPNLADNAIDAQLDLVEDDDIQIRKEAIKNLPLLCRESKEHVPKIADILAQLFIVEDVTELQQVHNSLQALFKISARNTFAGIFSQITTGDEATREKCLKYLSVKMKSLGSDIITTDIEDFVITEIKKILQDVTADEFQICMGILAMTKLGKTITGHNELVQLSIEQAELNFNIDPITIEEEIVERFIQCATTAQPYLSSKINSTIFVRFLCEKLFPISTWNMLTTTCDQNQLHLRLLKTCAQLCTTCGPLDKPAEKLESIYAVLKEYIPVPPLDGDIENTPSFQFSHAECLLYTLHTIGKQCPEYFNFNDENKLKEFRSRLQFLARGAQGYIRKLQDALKGKTIAEQKSEEYLIKATALKTTSNISILIRELFRSPPIFKSTIQLSWLTPKKEDNKEPIKRHTSILYADKGNKNDGLDSNIKKNRVSNTQKVYTPPSGKYSGNIHRNNPRRKQFLNNRNGKKNF